MKTINENLCCQLGDSDKDALVVFVRDREVENEERWVAASLSSSEAQSLFELLQNRFN